MDTIENFDLIEAISRHSKRMTLWQDSGLILDFDTLASEILDEADREWPFWDYYNDPKASDLFDQIMATGIVTYYARPKEDFSIIQGIRQIYRESKSFAIMEDMS